MDVTMQIEETSAEARELKITISKTLLQRGWILKYLN